MGIATPVCALVRNDTKSEGDCHAGLRTGVTTISVQRWEQPQPYDPHNERKKETPSKKKSIISIAFIDII